MPLTDRSLESSLAVLVRLRVRLIRASGPLVPLPLPGHLTPALLLPLLLLSNFLRCPAPPAPPDRETPCSLFLSGSDHFVQSAVRSHLEDISVTEQSVQNNCQVAAFYKLLHLRSVSICGSSLLQHPFHPSPSAAITPNYSPPLATLLATCQPTLSVAGKGGNTTPWQGISIAACVNRRTLKSGIPIISVCADKQSDCPTGPC